MSDRHLRSKGAGAKRSWGAVAGLRSHANECRGMYSEGATRHDQDPNEEGGSSSGGGVGEQLDRRDFESLSNSGAGDQSIHPEDIEIRDQIIVGTPLSEHKDRSAYSESEGYSAYSEEGGHSEYSEYEDHGVHSEEDGDSVYSEDEDQSIHSDDAEIYNQAPHYEGSSSHAGRVGGPVPGNEGVMLPSSGALHQLAYSANNSIPNRLPSFRNLDLALDRGTSGLIPPNSGMPTATHPNFEAGHQPAHSEYPIISAQLPSIRTLDIYRGGVSEQLPDLRTLTAVNLSYRARQQPAYAEPIGMSHWSPFYHRRVSTSIGGSGGQHLPNFGTVANPRYGSENSNPLRPNPIPRLNVPARSPYNDEYPPQLHQNYNILSDRPAYSEIATAPLQPQMAPSRPVWSSGENRRLFELFDNRMPPSEIAKEMGCSEKE